MTANLVLKQLFIVLFICSGIGARSDELPPAKGSDVMIKHDRSIRVFILAGQSNAVGYNNTKEYKGGLTEFPETLGHQPGILFYGPQQSSQQDSYDWNDLRVAKSEKGHTGSFGPEIGFAHELAGTMPGQKIAIIKYAVGGTGIARSRDYSDYIPSLGDFKDGGRNWHPPADGRPAGQLYQTLLAHVRNALTALDRDGKRWKLAGFLWMQGEHEAGISRKMAQDYERLLEAMIKALRADLKAPSLPFGIGQINSHNWAFGEIARKGQLRVCQRDKDAILVKTVDLPRTGSGGAAHFNADGMLQLGRRFASAWLASSGGLSVQQDNALGSFRMSESLKAVRWAGSDMIHSPVAMDVDAKGRVWVTEDLQHSGLQNAPHARIKILADSDNDGRADTVKIFGPTFSSKPLGISVFDNVIVVSMAPNIHVYTDLNRDDVFDPKVDTEEIIAKGFHGRDHDHALHAVVPGPSGKWYVNHGNIGADVTMADGREIHASSYYSQNPASIGKLSHDGRLYVGGFGLRMDPDGGNAELVFQNTRNPHAMLVTSFGDILQGDNDDPTHARAAWVMEFSNFGYASLENGNRSWEDSAKSWEEKVVTKEIMESAYERHSKSSLRRDEGHWRQHFPGVTPPGNMWGPGAPTGDYFIEGDELGKEHRGLYLLCETVHRAVFSFRPELRDAQIELLDLNKAFFAADRNSSNKSAAAFLPTDIVANTDGSLFVSDWNSSVNARGSGNAEGGIFRLAREDEARVQLPAIDFMTTAGLLAALKSPAPGVRWVAQDKLKQVDGATDALLGFIKANAENPYYRARAVFILAQLSNARAVEYLETLLNSADAQERIVAFRALRLAGREPMLPIVAQLADDSSPAVRREVMHALRNVELSAMSETLTRIIAGYDGKNRWYLEALGAVCDGRSDEVYDRIVRPLQPNPKEWTVRQKNLAWRLRSAHALDDLAECILEQDTSVDSFRRLAYTFGLSYNAAERARNRAFMARFGEHPRFQGKGFQLVISEFLEKDINDPAPVALTRSYLIPKSFGTATELDSVDDIAALESKIRNGQAKAALCLMCHKIGKSGVSFGPDLSNWGQVRDVQTIIRALIDPSAERAHGFDQALVVTQKGHRLEGISKGYSWHAGAIRVKTVGGITLKVPHRQPHAKIEYLKNHSWMPSASAMGLTNQDVRDIAAYLMSSDLGQSAAAEPKLVPKFSRGLGPGWVELTGEDFVNVNCRADTWKWEGSHTWCTGKPTGVIRYREPLRNFELSADWMHKQKGGNSGIFVWATAKSLINLIQGKASLPHGIEVQVLDLGYREIYEAQYKKKGDWFTSHGDVFPVGPIKMIPFAPVAPNGRRSFPSQNTTLGIHQWNHYYLRGIDGEIRLWVNGVEVSGGNQINPATGYLCLESEGAPIEFRNIRLRKLPPYHTPLPDGIEIPVPDFKQPESLKNHAILGKWIYLESYTREFLAEGRCILRNGNDVIWTKDVIASSPESVTLEGGYQHKLDGKVLEIEGRYRAKRSSP